ncbi:hypothetical protein QC763_105380 [Podospora pseudopauciseta]|uniref:Uncharacterized protein n=1 Tax=Podospora pseudopauciseta TaxID=2093780 RepID=A0ABR0HXS0_9PEZI|nr:hypothetical protein QC763_105380 [Podospora pseudopauciseta]
MPHNTRYPSPSSASTGRSHHSSSSTSYHYSPVQQTVTINRPNVPDFRFCMELGLVLRSRTLDHKESAGLEKELSRTLTKQNIPNSVITSSLKQTSSSSSSYAVQVLDSPSSREWTITTEASIPDHAKDHRFGIKLVSPFMRFTATKHESWLKKIYTLFHVLEANFEVTSSHQCFTHIHIVPERGYWTYGQLECLAKSALYFESCLDELVPPYRRKSVWAKSNRYNAYFGSAKSMRQCFDKFDKGGKLDINGLAMRMNWCSANSATGLSLSEDGQDFMTDTYRWSFNGLVAQGGDGCGTVAFKQPPGSTSAEDAVGWVMLVGCFARLACVLGETIRPEDKPLIKSLGEWLVYEASWCQLPRVKILKDLLRQAMPEMREVAGGSKGKGKDVEAITIDEDSRLRAKQGERELVGEKYLRMLKHIH